MKPLRTLSIGGATYDLFLSMKKEIKIDKETLCLQIGGKLQVGQVIESCGGGACNTAVSLSRLGCDAGFCGITGSDQWGEKLRATLQKEGVDLSSMTIVENETSSFSIVICLPNGERTILYTPGINEHLQDATFDLEAIDTVQAVFLNHLSETACMIEDDLIESILSKPHVRLAWNPGGCQIDVGMDAPEKKRLLQSTELLLLNKEEALHFTRSSTVEEALQKLTKAGVKNSCVTDGKQGTCGTDGTHMYHCPVPEGIVPIDTTGAGDAFGSAALWALLRGHSLQTSMICGTLNATSVIKTIGAQAGLLTENQIEEQLSQHLLVVQKIS